MTRIAIIGAGTIGAVHATAYRAAGAELVAVVEPAPEPARTFAHQFGVAAYPDLQSLLASEDRPTAVSICTPPFTHRELVQVAVDAGLDILCEKPMAHTLDDAEAIFRAAESSTALFATAYCHRFQPEIEALAQLAATGRIGAVRSFYNAFTGNQPEIEKRWFGVKRLAGGGAVMDTAIHSIDIFRFLCGEIADASGVITKALDGIDLDVEHTATVGLVSESGIVGTIDCSWKSAPGRAVVMLTGSTGRLTFDYAQPGQVLFEDENGNAEHIPAAGEDRFVREVRSFLQAAETGDAPRTGAADGLIGVAVVDAVYRASANRSVAVPSLDVATS